MTQPIALVLAGGGARGAYEAGALSVLLPALPEDERPNLIVGASVGAVNGAYLAATLPTATTRRSTAGRALWEDITWGDVLATPSLRDLDRIARAALNFTGLLSLDVPALLDATPLSATLERLIPFERDRPRTSTTGRLISRRRRRDVRADRPQRRLPPGRDAGRGRATTSAASTTSRPS